MKFNKVTFAVLLALSGGYAPLASAEATSPQDGVDIEKIQVTGSRIKGVDLEGAQPLVSISAEDIKRSGANTLYDVMKNIPQLSGGNGTFSSTESGATSTSTPAGQAAASLRGMGPSSTLTLINGRRIAPSSFAAGTENFVDINSIPAAAIERIEVLATGASATYGADAVAGVINYILKKDYEGFEINLSYEDSTASSSEAKKSLNLYFGTEVGGGNLTLFADVFDREAMQATDRDFIKDRTLASSYSYLPTLSNTPNVYYKSGYNFYELGSPGCKSELVETEYDEMICANYSYEHAQLQTEMESYSAGFSYNKEFDNLIWHTDFFFSHSESIALSRPAPINRVDDTEGPMVPASVLTDVYGENGENLSFVEFDPDSETYVTYTGLDALDAIYYDYYDSPAGRELEGFAFDARFEDPRTVEVETDSYRLVSTLSGELDEWSWETGVTLSKSESEQVAVAGIYNRYKFHAALAGELCSDGTTASYDSGADTLSCAGATLMGSYNPYLVGDAANDSVLAATQEMPTRSGKSAVYGWDAQISGDLFEFNDQTAVAAFGVEARYEELSDTPSLNSRANYDNGYLVDVFGFGSSVAEADRMQYAAFAEFIIPLTEKFEVQLAGRYDHYDDFGGTFNPKVAFNYRPFDSLILRGSWATSFRAPSLTQAGVKLRTTRSTFDCGANQAVADLYCEGDGTERTVNSLELGNQDLKAEESESLAFGLGWSPTESTTITVDYWQFEHDEIIDTNMTRVLDQAMTDSSLRHCGLVAEGEMGVSYEQDICEEFYNEETEEWEYYTDSNGKLITDDGANLTEILTKWATHSGERYAELPLYRDHVIPLENTGTQSLAGIDYTFDQFFRFSSGTLDLYLSGTHYLAFDRNRPGSDSEEELISTWRYPENFVTAGVEWGTDDYYLALSASYTDSYEDDISGLKGREIDELWDMGALNENEERDVDSWTQVDLSAGYFLGNMTFRVAVKNLLDEEPPVAYGSSLGYDSINANALGRSVKFSFTYAID